MTYLSDNDKIYNSWRKMKIRCTDPMYHSYHRYGGRGICVCERWQDYTKFKLDMADTWFAGATLERKNNNGHYEPGNCVWLPKNENTKPLKYDIQEMLALSRTGLTQAEVGAHYGLSQDRVSKLLKRARGG